MEKPRLKRKISSPYINNQKTRHIIKRRPSLVPEQPSKHIRQTSKKYLRQIDSILSVRGKPTRRRTPVNVRATNHRSEHYNAVSTPKDSLRAHSFEELVKPEIERYLNISDIDTYEYRSYSPIITSDIIAT